MRHRLTPEITCSIRTLAVEIPRFFSFSSSVSLFLWASFWVGGSGHSQEKNLEILYLEREDFPLEVGSETHQLIFCHVFFLRRSQSGKSLYSSDQKALYSLTYGLFSTVELFLLLFIFRPLDRPLGAIMQKSLRLSLNFQLFHRASRNGSKLR